MPKDFRVTRATSVAASPERIHALIDDFHEWQKWSPWEGLDGDMERTYAGPSSGVGAVYAWKGNRKAGEGRMEILESSPERVVVDLDFAAPMRAQNRIAFALVPSTGGTDVEWVMTGPQNLVMRLMSKIYSMEKMVGPDFERGLGKLKQVAEQA